MWVEGVVITTKNWLPFCFHCLDKLTLGQIVGNVYTCTSVPACRSIVLTVIHILQTFLFTKINAPPPCRYIPVLMQQAKIYWDMEHYTQVEKIFRKSVEFCNEHDMWKLNVAHVLFMQENKYKEAIGFYEPIVKKNYDNVSQA